MTGHYADTAFGVARFARKAKNDFRTPPVRILVRAAYRYKPYGKRLGKGKGARFPIDFIFEMEYHGDNMNRRLRLIKSREVIHAGD